MLRATPSAHPACPAAASGMIPIRNVGADPRWGVRVKSGKVRPDGTKTSSTS